MRLAYYLDVTVMLAQRRFTGIAAVACAMADWQLRNHRHDTHFFSGNDLVSPDVVETIVRMRSGAAMAETGGTNERMASALPAALAHQSDRLTVGLTPNIKTARNVFDYETQLIYDLTYAVLPEFHRDDVVAAYGSAMDVDIRSNDLNICISEWTKHDLVTYFGVDPGLCLVAHLGYDQSGLADRSDVEPFYLMLGTIEPRKNHALVFAAIRQAPGILKSRRLVIVGDEGWGETVPQMLDRHGLSRMLGREIVYAGFVSDPVRARLLQNARALFYPSFYEGFGLPVVEAMAAGTPVIASTRSSLPEVGGDAAFYADPESVDSFLDALRRLEAAFENPVERASVQARMQARAATFSWETFHRTIAARIESDISNGRYRRHGAR